MARLRAHGGAGEIADMIAKKGIGIALEILRALYKNQTQLPISASSLGRQLGLSTRTIFRYVDELICCGIPINSARGRYGGLTIERR